MFFSKVALSCAMIPSSPYNCRYPLFALISIIPFSELRYRLVALMPNKLKLEKSNTLLFPSIKRFPEIIPFSV